MDNAYDLLKKRLRGLYVKLKQFPLSYPPPRKQTASLSMTVRPYEAVFKVCSFQKTPPQIKAAMLYISRNSDGLEQDVPLYNDLREALLPNDFNKQIASYNIKQKRKNGNQTVHFILSFPKKMCLKTDDVHRFTERYLEPFAKEQFRYVMAVHTHQSAVHAHVILNLSNGRDRLCFKKKQLYMMRQHQAAVAREFGWNMQATRFVDRDFSLSGIVVHTKHKTLLERQVPCWYRQRKRDGGDFPVRKIDVPEQTQQALSAWAKSFKNADQAVQSFLTMYLEKPKTALWYANHRANVFGEINKKQAVFITEKTLKGLLSHGSLESENALGKGKCFLQRNDFKKGQNNDSLRIYSCVNRQADNRKPTL